MKKNNLEDTHIVSRSRPLLSLGKSELSLYELKVLDTYLSRINSHEPDERTVIFDKGEFEELFDYAKMKLPELKKHLYNLQSLKVDIAKNEDEIDSINLFSRATATKDKYGLWEVTLTCSPEAMQYFFNIESLGYLRYKLWNVLRLESRYSYLLFLYLVDNRFRKQWSIDLDELKIMLNCQNVASYSAYKNFRRVVLEKCKAEILEKTDIVFDYSVLKRGRFVQKIQFDVTTWGELANIKQEIEAQQQPTIEVKKPNSDITIMCDICNDIKPEEMQVIYDLLLQLNIDKGKDGTGRVDYFKYLVDRMKVAETKKPIKDHSAYIKAMLLKEIESK